MVTPEIIAKSFKKCGISNAIEGFSATDVEDTEVHSSNIMSGTTNDQYELDAESDTDSAHEEDLDYQPMSPGH